MNSELKDVAKKIKVFFCDSDGVLFPNTVLMGAPHKAKYRSYYDGLGLLFLRELGIRIVFITNEKGESAAALLETVDKLNSLPSSKPQKADGWEPIVLYEGCNSEKKLETAKEFLNQNGLTLEESAYMGDDLIDAPLLRAVALPSAPAQAEEAIKSICKFVAKREGGAGAIRDFANMILEARGIDPFTLPTQ
ncbi:MAG: 3-deoxy-D-manno-octulosonate 8-phosphate phosphatase (KDO 8-P phosphatase) [Parcubacteria group bacterium Gr01-1014_91]|nr:MAG: 3-deoxy-D-manno-octulosonate 8-phosphate phosphatase (KDO 8-P phosphatase) [Parcubacteria group bacterium Gr01-1014_91]